MINKKRENRRARHRRIRSRVKGTSSRPRFSVFRSNKHLRVQLIDDETGRTMVHADDLNLKKDGRSRAEMVGEVVAKASLSKGIETVVFDRGGYKFHGLIKAVAEGARKGGLRF